MQPFLKVDQVTKRFHKVVANDRVSFDVMPGEIHCLLGENGAGKSTIAECIYGFYRPDEGTITVQGDPAGLTSARDAIARGVGLGHQPCVPGSLMTGLANTGIGPCAD